MGINDSRLCRLKRGHWALLWAYITSLILDYMGYILSVPRKSYCMVLLTSCLSAPYTGRRRVEILDNTIYCSVTLWIGSKFTMVLEVCYGICLLGEIFVLKEYCVCMTDSLWIIMVLYVCDNLDKVSSRSYLIKINLVLVFFTSCLWFVFIFLNLRINLLYLIVITLKVG